MKLSSEEAKIKSSANRWKKGNTPPNIGKDGEVRWREGLGYMFIRLSERNWVLYNKWLWEQDNGAVPAGFNIVFKDGNSKNCLLENLECISNAELMSRNTIQRYPEALRDIIMLKGKLNKAIKNQEKL